MSDPLSAPTKPYLSPLPQPSAESAGALLREATIRKSVLAALGRPHELLRVAVVPLWGNNFRVNVWASGNAGAWIPNSYFVTADDTGKIIGATPPIQKQY